MSLLLQRSHNDHDLFPDALGRDAFAGRWQLARTPGDWQDDLKVTHSR